MSSRENKNCHAQVCVPWHREEGEQLICYLYSLYWECLKLYSRLPSLLKATNYFGNPTRNTESTSLLLHQASIRVTMQE
uniref:Uncharacterized protein n=1 Tax=Salix viminalis TaxID=40686 RepID=A0A6N2N0S8_SALVM